MDFNASVVKDSIIFYLIVSHECRYLDDEATLEVLEGVQGGTAKHSNGHDHLTLWLNAMDIDEIEIWDNDDIKDFSRWFDDHLDDAIDGGYDTMLEAYYAGVPVEDIIA